MDEEDESLKLRLNNEKQQIIRLSIKQNSIETPSFQKEQINIFSNKKPSEIGLSLSKKEGVKPFNGDIEEEFKEDDEDLALRLNSD